MLRVDELYAAGLAHGCQCTSYHFQLRSNQPFHCLQPKIMTPRILHYVWIGGGIKRPLHEKCISSWHRNLKDWEIIEWNDSNIDMNKARHISRYFRTAYDNRIYEFIADYARLVVLKEHGGVYVDTHIEITRDFTPLLSDNFFIGMQFPDARHSWALEGAVMCAPPDHPFINEGHSD